MKLSFYSCLILLSVAILTTVANARGTPEQGIENIEKAIRPAAHYTVPEFVCTYSEEILITQPSTPAPSAIGPTALCRTALYEPPVVVSGRYWRKHSAIYPSSDYMHTNPGAHPIRAIEPESCQMAKAPPNS